MARLGQAFKPTEHNTDQNDFGTVPDGIYQLEMIASDTREEGNNQALTVTYSVIQPEEFKGRYIFGWFDINNDDAEKQRRGNQDFSKLCRAIGYDEAEEGILEDSEALHLRSFTARVKDSPAGVSKAGKPYKAKNQINLFYYPDEGNVPEPGITAPKATPANDNRPAARAANDNARPAQAATGERPKTPWGAKK